MFLQGELSRALAPAVQAMRLATRAVNSISRLAPSPPKPPTSPVAASTFTAPPTNHVTPLADALPVNERKTGASIPSGVHAGLSWQLLEVRSTSRSLAYLTDLTYPQLLLNSIERVAVMHFIRGTPKSADFFAQQAMELAEDVGSANTLARALLLRADVRLQWGKQEEATADLDRVSQLLRSVRSLHIADEAATHPVCHRSSRPRRRQPSSSGFEATCTFEKTCVEKRTISISMPIESSTASSPRRATAMPVNRRSSSLLSALAN